MNMTKKNEPSEIRLERRLRAPVARVFRAWQDPKDLKAWAWGSIGRKVKADVEFRKGGKFSISTSGSDGQPWSFSGTYTEIVPNHKVVHTLAWDAPMGYAPMPETVTVDLTDNGEGTTVVFKHAGAFSKEARAGHSRGWENVLDTLARHLDGK